MYFMIVAFISPGKFSKIVFIICTVSLAIFHPHFSIRILSSVFFFYPHFFYPPSAIRRHPVHTGDPFETIGISRHSWELPSGNSSSHWHRLPAFDPKENKTALSCCTGKNSLTLCLRQVCALDWPSREELGQRVWIECKASCFEDLSTFDWPLFSEFSTMPGGKVFVVGVGMTKVSSKIIFWG